MSYPEPRYPEPRYPEPRYLADHGATSAILRPAITPPDLSTRRGAAVHYLATGATTSGEFGLYRWEMDARRSGPAPHFHRTISESFYVLSGTVRLFDGTRWLDAVGGDFLFVPPGGVHGFRNESGAPASMLLLFTPGAPREAYFEELAEITASGRELSDAEWTQLFAGHDQYPA
jgi:mannose-6-phosphate isomerase-like protein (cupin superfamily)